MQKKPSGLGRGLDDLLEDNTLSKRQNTGKPLVEARGEAGERNTTTIKSSIYEVKTKTLYETKPKTRSVKANFKNIK